MKNEYLNYLIRKNKGKELGKIYKQIFLSVGLQETDLDEITLDKSDAILNKIRNKFPAIAMVTEDLIGSDITSNSKILCYLLVRNKNNFCYIYSDDVYYCGMYRVHLELAIKYSLEIAQKSYSKICVILDEKLEFIISVLYLNEKNNTGQFEIQAKFAEQIELDI